MYRRTIAGAALALLAAVPAFGQAIPKEMSWTAYDTGSSGFNIAVAIGQQFKNVLGTDVRVLPSGNDTGRLAPVKANRAVISQMGIGTYFAQEGVFEFGTKSWGPQPTRLIMAATACNGLGLAVAKDTGVKEVKDLKGKRLGIVVGSPALSQGVIALIAFGGLSYLLVLWLQNARGYGPVEAGLLMLPSTLGIFLPSFVLVAILGNVLQRVRHNRFVRGALDGMNAAVAALILVVTIQLADVTLGRPNLSAPAFGIDPLLVGVTAVSAGLLLRFDLNASWIVLLAAGVGVARALSGGR